MDTAAPQIVIATRNRKKGAELRAPLPPEHLPASHDSDGGSAGTH